MNKRSAGIGGVALIIIIVVILAGGGYFLAKVRPSKVSPPIKSGLTPTEVIEEEESEESPTEEPEEEPTEESEEDEKETPTPEDKEEKDDDEKLGSIEGTLGYPSEGIPPLEVYAISQSTGKYYFIKTYANQAKFEIEDVEPGTYVVVAYAANLAGGYTKAVPCGLSVDCKDHSLIPVEVKSGEKAGGVEVKDWYAEESDFPKKPK